MEPRYFDNVPNLMAEVDKLYAKITTKYPEKTKTRMTMDKIIAERGWTPSLSLIKKNFEKVLTDLNFFFVPKIMVPGPLFVFPIRGLDGKFTYAQTRPMEGSALFGKSKYYFLGERPYTPNWLGNTPETILTMMKLKKVLLVEGPFDLLACRLLCPDLPILSPLTKKVGKKHEAFLRMLGIKTMYLMFDNELAKRDDKFGAGDISMAAHMKDIKSMNVLRLTCSAPDPSATLKMEGTARQLKRALTRELSPATEYYEEEM